MICPSSTKAPAVGFGPAALSATHGRRDRFPAAQFQDQDKFMVFRYYGKLPMAGVWVADVYHVLWIEPEFGKLYDHG